MDSPGVSIISILSKSGNFGGQLLYTDVTTRRVGLDEITSLLITELWHIGTLRIEAGLTR